MISPANYLQLNRDCNCFPLVSQKVRDTVSSLSEYPDMRAMLEQRKNYFASTPVFIAPQMVAAMRKQILTIEQVINLPAYQSEIFSRSALAAFAPSKSTQGAFMGYDFHITENGPRLIEINSNAGGAFIVNALQKAVGQSSQVSEDLIRDMFFREWELSGNINSLSFIAIIDERPEDQFHYPDMLLAANLFRRYGLDVHITDPKHLEYRKDGVYIEDRRIDLIYNRLTDFDFQHPEHQPLRQAWLDKAVIITPDPRHHALYADKRNLTILTDQNKLESWGVDDAQKEVLSHIPKTIEVNRFNAERLWLLRKNYFFKPFAGYGSRAVYKGAKLTTKTWKHILQGGYVAQEFVRPPIRKVSVQTETVELKYDIRVYSYNGSPLLMGARVYQGQVTNLRTVGGGLAPVIEIKNRQPELICA